MVKPNMMGMMVDLRDQVRITAFWPLFTSVSTFFASFSSTNGPFFTERDNLQLPNPGRACGQ